jgi:DNA-binding response OmpR family regulator
MFSAPVAKGRILCTEDHRDSREVLLILLEQEGYQVTVPLDCWDALAVARRKEVDLILVDKWMAGLSGTELTRKVREFDKTTPILFFSGAAYVTDQQEARDAGAQGYLVKPDGLHLLFGEIAKLIAEAKAKTFVD